MAGKTEKAGGSCEFCAHYEYDDEMDCYVCEMNLDEDEMVLFCSTSIRPVLISASAMTTSWRGASK